VGVDRVTVGGMASSLPSSDPDPDPDAIARDLADAPRAPWAEEVETHRRIRGRRWRVSDPRIPDELRQQLVDELMDARRAVGSAAGSTEERAARDRVQDAKVALGERGLRWWRAELDDDAFEDRIRRAAGALHRGGTSADRLVDAVAAVTSVSADRVTEALRGHQLDEEPAAGTDEGQRSGR
jgi:hypothetical protein